MLQPMVELMVPSTGLQLDGFPTDDAATTTKENDLQQVMLLDLADAVWDELLRTARHGGKPPQISFGNHIALHYGTKQQQLSATSSTTKTQVFLSSGSEETGKLTLTGRTSHLLAMQRAEKQIAGADEALTKLQNSLASEKHKKESLQTIYVADNSKLPPTVKQTAARLKQNGKNSPLSFLKHQGSSPRPNNHSPRPHTPLGSLQRPNPSENKHIPTSAPDHSKDKSHVLQAIRTPLIHLLAVRPFSTKYLTQNIKCAQGDIDTLLKKVGKSYRLDDSKWDLNDRTYKELDVWKFNYPNQDDRELAIQRAVSAFDRLRMSQEEPQWQMLYQPHDRNKGKTLSKFNYLHKGPIQQSTTPRIHVQRSDEPRKDTPTANQEKLQSGRLTPASESMARSRVSDLVKKEKSGSKTNKVKRLQSNGPKPVKPVSASKDAPQAAKKGGRKVAVPLSSEFVHDSDEEDGLEETLAPEAEAEAESSQKSHTAKASSLESPPIPKPKTASIKSESGPSIVKKPLSKQDKEKGHKSNNVKAAQLPSNSPKVNASTVTSVKANGVTKTTGKIIEKTTRKPTGKSTNKTTDKMTGKETSKETSKTASSSSDTKVTPKKIPSSPASTPGAKARLSEANQAATAMQKSSSRQRTLSSPFKPSPLGSSPPTNVSEMSDSRDSSSSLTPPNKTSAMPNGLKIYQAHNRDLSNVLPKTNGITAGSDASLKRKANDIDSGIHNHSSPPTSDSTNSVNSVKRHKYSPDSHPGGSDSSTSTSPMSDREIAIREAQRFKVLYAKYAKAYREAAASPSPPANLIDRVKKMHYRLQEMKRTIRMSA